MTPASGWRPPVQQVEVLEVGSPLSRAEIALDCGFNFSRWTVQIDDQPVEILWPGVADHRPDTNAQDSFSPLRFGIPILFPFPNRISQGVFEWSGREYRLPINDPHGRNAIHGFVADLPWRLTQAERHSDSALVTATWQLSRDGGARRQLWPADFSITLTWQLRQAPGTKPAVELSARVVVCNVDTVPLPCGLGFHPYFAIPAEDAQVLVLSALEPRAELLRWELRDLIPTGRLVPLREEDRRLIDDRLTGPLPAWDDAFRLVTARQDDPLVVLVRDRRRRFAIRIVGDPAFRDLVLFVPPHRQAVCVEPYSCVTDAIRLHARGVSSGLRVLLPGQSWLANLTLSVLPEA